MVQATRHFFSLAALAFATLTTAYAAPSKRACVADLTQNVLLSALVPGGTEAIPLELQRTPQDYVGYTDHVLIVSHWSSSYLY